MTNKKHLSHADIEWAWEKWSEGYRQADIAKVLGVCYRTIHRKLSELQDAGRKRAFGWNKKRELEELKR